MKTLYKLKCKYIHKLVAFRIENTIQSAWPIFAGQFKVYLGSLVVGWRPTVRLWDLSLWGRALRGGDFLGILARICASLGENHGKLQTARSTSVTEVWTHHLPSNSFEGRIPNWSIICLINGFLKTKPVLENKNLL